MHKKLSYLECKKSIVFYQIFSPFYLFIIKTTNIIKYFLNNLLLCLKQLQKKKMKQKEF